MNIQIYRKYDSEKVKLNQSELQIMTGVNDVVSVATNRIILEFSHEIIQFSFYGISQLFRWNVNYFIINERVPMKSKSNKLNSGSTWLQY